MPPALPYLDRQPLESTVSCQRALDFLSEVRMKPGLVSRDPEIMSGALCFAGTRVPVKNLFDYLEGSSSLDQFLEDFPSVTRATAVAVLEEARKRFAADASAAR